MIKVLCTMMHNLGCVCVCVLVNKGKSPKMIREV